MDIIERTILTALQKDGRISLTDLANQVGLSVAAMRERVLRLQERGVIRGYTALLNPERLGLGLMAFVAVTIDHPRHNAAFLSTIGQTEEVLECHHIAGDDSYWLKVIVPNTRALETLVTERLKQLDGVVRTRTTIILSSPKETTALPLIGVSHD